MTPTLPPAGRILRGGQVRADPHGRTDPGATSVPCANHWIQHARRCGLRASPPDFERGEPTRHTQPRMTSSPAPENVAMHDDMPTSRVVTLGPLSRAGRWLPAGAKAVGAALDGDRRRHRQRQLRPKHLEGGRRRSRSDAAASACSRSTAARTSFPLSTGSWTISTSGQVSVLVLLSTQLCVALQPFVISADGLSDRAAAPDVVTPTL
jgi:hypothetical protein